jgi:5-methyltetrahydrofolate--homocysteine methyltransferase
MQEEEALKLTAELLDGGTDALSVLEACQKAMGMIGKRYEEGIYFLPELILAGEMMNQISELIKPKLSAAAEVARIGKVVIGTVQGDIHDIGKDTVSFMLDVNGFEVRDLGVDVSAQKFVEAIREFQPQVVGLSGFLTLAFDEMKGTVSAISDAGLRDSVKIMIGGGQMDEQVRKYTGADAYGKDAMAAVNLAKGWIGG